MNRSVIRPVLLAVLAAAAIVTLGLAATRPAHSPVRSLDPPLPAPVNAAAAGIEGVRLHDDVAFLADDMLEGRGTGTRGYDLAARYVAARFGTLGLEPAGTDGYLQPVPFRRAVLDEAASSIALTGAGGRALVQGTDVILSPDFLREAWTTEAPLVFVGYGVSAPEMGHDDFAGIDVHGKVLVEFRGAPPRFPHNERAYYSNNFTKEQMAAAHGAIGILNVIKTSDAARFAWPRVVRQAHLPGFRWTDAGGAPANTQALIELGGILSRSGADAVFAGAPKTFDQAVADAESSVVNSFALPLGVKAHRTTHHTATTSPNVVGLLRGSDPRRTNEAIVMTAHLDHLGISAPVNGDSINNGAYDNASGTAMMLEVARAFSRAGVRPKRSILFVAVTGEEKGLQGSDYFASQPGPKGLTVVGDVNLDEVMLLRPMTKIVSFGAEHSSLGPLVEKAAGWVGLGLMPDPVPEEVVFVRSDQFSFVKQGVPGIFPVSGSDGTAEGGAEIMKWDQDRYHSPSDDMTQVFDWDSGARFTRMAFYATWLAADALAAPAWNKGDFFGTRFGAKR